MTFDVEFKESDMTFEADMSAKILIQGPPADDITVDQYYNPESKNAQSGKAVAEALSEFPVLKHLTTVVTTEDCTEITVDGLNISSGVISGRLSNTGANAKTGFGLGINGKVAIQYLGSASAVKFWIWKENGKYVGRANVGSSATNNTYNFSTVEGDITSVTVKNAYHANGGYYATGTTLELFEGVRPNA